MTGGAVAQGPLPLRCYSFAALRRLGIRHGTFTRQGGVSEPPFLTLNCAVKTEDPRAAENRRRVLAALRMDPAGVIYASGCHGRDIVIADDLPLTAGSMTVLCGVDGLIARRPGLCLSLCVADCLPVFFAAPAANAVGLVHAGWHGVHLEILPAAIELFAERYGARPDDLIVAFGPAIHKESYRARNPSQLGDPRWQPYLSAAESGEYHVDFIAMARQQVLAAGVRPDNLTDCGICTAEHNAEFFSCHREGYRSGRFFNFIATSPAPCSPVEADAGIW